MITYAILIAGAAWIGSMIAVTRPFEGEVRPFRLQPKGGALFGALAGLVFCLAFVGRGRNDENTTPTSMEGNVVVIHTIEGFEKAVLESSIPAMVIFFSPDCRSCKAVTPILNGIADVLAEQETPPAIICKVNIATSYKLSEKCRVMGLPDVRVFVNGEEKAQLVGFHPREKYLADLGKYAELPAMPEETQSVSEEQDATPPATADSASQ